MSDKKTCTRCQTLKPLTQFQKFQDLRCGVGFRRHAWCSMCRSVHNRQYKKAKKG